MYQLSIFFEHSTEERVKEACDRVCRYLRQVRKEPSDVTIEDPDERNEDYLSRIRLELPDKHFLGVIAECVRENYCNARVFFVKKGYAPIDGVVDGNVWGVVLSGALDDVYRIAKKLKHPGVSVEPEMNIKKRSTKYSHLRLVE